MKISWLFVCVVIALAMEVSGATGFEKEKVVFYQRDEVLSERVPNHEALAQYTQELVQVCSKYLAGETTPESLDIVVAVKPGKESRVWFVSSRKAGDEKRDSLRKALEAVTPCEVAKGPVAFAIIGKIAGGDDNTKQGGESEPPMPEEWRKAAATSDRPLIVPDSILWMVWPNKK